MLRSCIAALLLLAPSTVALAHDTVLLAVPGPATGQPVDLVLSSVVTFPTLDYGPLPERVAAAVASSGTLVVLDRAPQALRLRLVSARPGLHVASVSLKPITLTLPPSEVAHYLDEIAASPEVRAAAAATPDWTETYVKHAKALVCIAPCGDPRPAIRPSGAALEFVAGPGLRRFVLLHQGRPLTGHSVAAEWVGGVRRLLRTDASGGIDLPAEANGPTLLSAVRLVPPARAGAPWTSDFATLTFSR